MVRTWASWPCLSFSAGPRLVRDGGEGAGAVGRGSPGASVILREPEGAQAGSHATPRCSSRSIRPTVLGRARVVDSAPRQEADLLRCLVELRWHSTKPIAIGYRYLEGYTLSNAGVSVSPFPLSLMCPVHLSVVINGLPVCLFFNTRSYCFRFTC